MDRFRWNFGMRYELSGDGIGLLKYLAPKDFYHIHSDEMTHLERTKNRALVKLKGEVRFTL
jgi:hypothetical protein